MKIYTWNKLNGGLGQGKGRDTHTHIHTCCLGVVLWPSYHSGMKAEMKYAPTQGSPLPIENRFSGLSLLLSDTHSSNSDYVEEHNGENRRTTWKKNYGSLNDPIKQHYLGSLNMSYFTGSRGEIMIYLI